MKDRKVEIIAAFMQRKLKKWLTKCSESGIFMGENPFNIGKFIKNKRDAVGLSQDELGVICGISDATIQRIETGKTKQPGWELLCKLAKAVKIHPFEILKESGYITDKDISPSHRLNGLEDLDKNEIQSVQLYIDFMTFRKNISSDS